MTVDFIRAMLDILLVQIAFLRVTCTHRVLRVHKNDERPGVLC